MTTKPDNLEQEFDALLRSHIKEQQSAEPCNQFNPDNASTYLERALSQSALNSYENHLSACASCRHHIIELSRLIPTQTAAQNVIAQPPTSLQVRLGGWLSGWRLGLLSGIGATAAAVLLIAFIANQSYRDSASMVAMNNETISATPAAPLTEQLSDEQKPLVKLKDDGNTTANVSARSATPTLNPVEANQSQQLPATSTIPPLATGPGTQTGGANEIRIQSSDVPRSTEQIEKLIAQDSERQGLAFRNQPAERKEAQALAAAAPAPPPPAPKPAAEERAKDEAAAEAAVGRSDALATTSAKRADTRKRELDDSKAKSSRQSRPALKIVGGKQFSPVNGIWVDNTYDANKRLPVVRLRRDSDEYKNTLKDIPALKQYFELGLVTVVWQGKVYEVR